MGGGGRGLSWEGRGWPQRVAPKGGPDGWEAEGGSRIFALFLSIAPISFLWSSEMNGSDQGSREL